VVSRKVNRKLVLFTRANISVTDNRLNEFSYQPIIIGLVGVKSTCGLVRKIKNLKKYCASALPKVLIKQQINW
jgi:hypothetical protein